MQVELDMIERMAIRMAASCYYLQLKSEYDKECNKPGGGVPMVKNTTLIEMHRAEAVYRKFTALPRDRD